MWKAHTCCQHVHRIRSCTSEGDLRDVKLWKMLMVALRSVKLQKALPSGKLVQDSEMRFEDDLREVELRDADASRLLRNLCGDMYIDAAQLDNFVSSVRTIHAKCWAQRGCVQLFVLIPDWIQQSRRAGGLWPGRMLACTLQAPFGTQRGS